MYAMWLLFVFVVKGSEQREIGDFQMGIRDHQKIRSLVHGSVTDDRQCTLLSKFLFFCSTPRSTHNSYCTAQLNSAREEGGFPLENTR